MAWRTGVESMREEKYSGFAIASFVLSLVLIVWPFVIFFVRYLPSSIKNFLLLIMILLFVLSIIFGVISLIKIRKNKNLKGKAIAIISFIIAALSLILLYAVVLFVYTMTE